MPSNINFTKTLKCPSTSDELMIAEIKVLKAKGKIFTIYFKWQFMRKPIKLER